jgi:hypothetical protein
VAESDDADQHAATLEVLQRLGAWPVADLLARRLRELGARGLPRRPRRATRTNPPN